MSFDSAPIGTGSSGILERWSRRGLCWLPSPPASSWGPLGSRLLFRPAAVTAPAQDVPPAPAAPAIPVASNEPPPPPPPEPVRISMEDVVSELEHRYQGRQADKP
ncbi:MAG: hypothetical protein M3170_12080, partial [Candidatus Dormibacteraeota bacterium]|nr:hypothetical protein [Candidatus Dormibacteraeota bacterium]